MRLPAFLRWVLIALLVGVSATDLLAVNDHKTAMLQDAAGAASNGTAVDTTGYTSLGLQVVISDTATVTFEGTVDNSNWVATGCVATSDTATATVTSTTASKLYQCNVAGLAQFRARISSFTAGTGTVKGRLTTGPWSKRGGTGDALTTNPLSQFAATTSLQLKGVISDETGSGLLVFATSPTLTPPTIGAATATSINKMAVTAPTTSSTLAVADGKTLTASNTLTFTGTDGSSVAFGAGGTATYTIASGAKALATGAIASAACTSAQTDTATGTATTDAIIVSFNGDPTAVTGYVPLTTGMLTIIPYPTSNTVNFKVCNNSSASITPGAITLNWRVVR